MYVLRRSEVGICKEILTHL